MNQPTASQAKLNQDEFHRLFSLMQRQPWLAFPDRETPLLELISNCETLEEQNLVTALLERFVFIDGAQLREHLSRMVQIIRTDWSLSKPQTQIVATTYDDNPDSGQMVLEMLKPHLGAADWGDVVQVNKLGRALKNVNERTNIVLVDEFIGTGSTIKNRIEYIQKSLREPRFENPNPSFYVCSLACMEDAKKVITGCGAEVDAAVWLTKGISSNYVGQELHDATACMRRLEATLKQDINGEILPNFGRGMAEALYAMENGNIPNSVFPIFWWKYFYDGRPRKPMFHRQDLKYQ